MSVVSELAADSDSNSDSNVSHSVSYTGSPTRASTAGGTAGSGSAGITLVVSDASRASGGRYLCEASNGLGAPLTKLVTVTVNGEGGGGQ